MFHHRLPCPLRSAAIALVALLLPYPAAAGLPDPAMDRSSGGRPLGTVPALFGEELELPDTLGVGRVATDVARDLPRVEALADQLQARAMELGYGRVLPVLARDQAEMVEFLKRGIVDVVSEDPLEAAHDVAEADASVLLAEQREESDWLHVVVFVREDAAVRSLGDLAEECLVFPGGESGDSFLLPLAELRSSGLRLSHIRPMGGEPGRGEAGYLVLPAGTSVGKAVLRLVATAGSASSEYWEREAKAGNTEGLRIVHTFEKLPRRLVVVASSMDAKRRESLARVLMALPSDDAGKEALKRYGDVTAFHPLDASIRAALERAQVLDATVREEWR